MKLETWLARQGLSHTQFAKQLGTSQRLVSYWISGRHTPRLIAVARIEKATKGAVTMRDFVDVR